MKVGFTKKNGAYVEEECTLINAFSFDGIVEKRGEDAEGNYYRDFLPVNFAAVMEHNSSKARLIAIFFDDGDLECIEAFCTDVFSVGNFYAVHNPKRLELMKMFCNENEDVFDRSLCCSQGYKKGKWINWEEFYKDDI